MKKIILIAVLLISFACANSQSNYTYIAQRYRWLAGLFEALGLPAGSGPAAFAAGQNQRAGQVYYDSSGIDQGVYVWTGLTWQLIAGGSQTLQEVFDTEVGGSVLTKSDTILLSGFNLTIKGPGTTQYDFQPTQFNFLNQNAGSSTQITGAAGGGLDAVANFAGTNNGSNLNLSDGFSRLNAQNTAGPESNIYVYPDSIALVPQDGRLLIKGITEALAPKVLNYDPVTNLVTYGDGGSTNGTVRVDSEGEGERIWYIRTSDTTLILKPFFDTTYISWHTRPDSSMYALFDTAGLRTALGGANQALSNLTSPTAINQHLLPSADNVRDIGQSSAHFKDAYFYTARYKNAGGGTTTVQPLNSASNFTVSFPAATTTLGGLSVAQTWTQNNTFSGGAVFAQSGLLTNTTAWTSNLGIPTSATGGSVTQAELLFGGASTIFTRIMGRGNSTTTLGAGSSSTYGVIGNSQYNEATSGNHNLHATWVFRPQTINNAAATSTNGATLVVEGPMLGTAVYSDQNNNTWFQSGNVRFGTAGTSIGTASFEGNTSGRVLLTPAAAAGTPTLTFGTTSGILAGKLTNTAVLDFGSTSAGTSADLTVTVTGAADGDEVSIGVPNASTNANSSFTAWVSAANTVTIRFNNYSSGAIDPVSGTFRASVTKY